MERRLLALAAIPWMLSGIGVAQEPLVHQDRHVELRVHPGSLAAPLARGIADAAWATVQLVEARLKPLGLLPATKVTVEVHADDGRFRSALAESGAKFTVDEFAVGPMAIAHVALTPKLSAPVQSIVGLPAETRDAIVRQLAWLAAAQSEVGSQDPWLCQVFAAGLLDQVDNPKLASGVDVRFDARRLGYRRSLAQGEQFTLAGWVDWADSPADPTMWGSSWEMAGWCAQLLAEKTASWPKKLLTKAGPAKKLKEVTAVRRAQLGALLGARWDKTEERLQKLVADAVPGWHCTQPTVGLRDGRTMIAGTTEVPGRIVRKDGIPSGPFAVRGEAELCDVGEREWRIGFQHEGRTLGVLFGVARCLVAEWDGQRWRTLQQHEADEDCYRTVSFSVEVRDELHVMLGGEPVLVVPYGDFPMHAWVSVACNDGVVLLRNLRIEPIAPTRR